MNTNIKFNGEQAAKDLVRWMEDTAEREHMRGIVVGNSGGKDCAVVMAAGVKAFGKDKVFAVMLPNGEQKDIKSAFNVVEHLGIKHKVINIQEEYNTILAKYERDFGKPMGRDARVNLAPKIRMAWLTSIAQDMGLRTTCNGNASEAYVGYFTKWGDMCGDIRPLINLTCNEVIHVGLALELPEKTVLKAPEDGLTGKTDEENLGVLYDDIHYVIRGADNSPFREMCAQAYEKIEKLHREAGHKIIEGIPSFPFNQKYYEK